MFWALGSLLGLNLILLLSWATGVLFAGESTAGLGRLWLWLSEKLARDAKAAQLAPALLLLLQRKHLNRWALGTCVNGLWLIALLSALTLLLLLMATRRYGFVWETTILGADTFVSLTRGLGAIPSLLGFSVPTESMIRASGDNALAIENARQAWAGWLVGVLVVFGIFPRLLLTMLCYLRWRVGRRGVGTGAEPSRFRRAARTPDAQQRTPGHQRCRASRALHRVDQQVRRRATARAHCWSPSNSTINSPWPPELPEQRR